MQKTFVVFFQKLPSTDGKNNKKDCKGEVLAIYDLYIKWAEQVTMQLHQHDSLVVKIGRIFLPGEE